MTNSVDPDQLASSEPGPGLILAVEKIDSEKRDPLHARKQKMHSQFFLITQAKLSPQE